MGLIAFIKEAGEKLFGHKDVAQAQAEVAQKPDDADAKARAEDLDAKAGEAILAYIRTQNLSADGLAVAFDGASGAVTVSGTAPDQETREKIVLCCVAQQADEASYYTVVSGDTLSKISRDAYGDANKYMAIFEANKPMLSHPDKIYPGQVLRIPPLA
jgi:nucleoid-associated protein YgaU